MKNYLVIVCIATIFCGCSAINNYGKHGCDWRVTFLNTGINWNAASSSPGVYSAGQKDPKWIYCYESYQLGSNFNCPTAKECIIASNSFQSFQINSNSSIVINLPPPFPHSQWVVADDGFEVHSVPYYHIFNSTFCLESSEVTNTPDFYLSIQTIDAPIHTIYLNNTVVWSYTSGAFIFSLPNILVPRAGIQSGLNLLKIVTYKWDLALDTDPSNDNYIQSQYSALNVIGYLRTLKCCP